MDGVFFLQTNPTPLRGSFEGKCGPLQRTRCARTFASRAVFFPTHMSPEKMDATLFAPAGANSARHRGSVKYGWSDKMSETYPVLINGEKKGTLTVSREGLTTRFDAKCEDPGTLVRLSVYGGGKEGYLGVMTPENGVLTLHRRLTRAALAAFPAEIELAAEAGRNTSAPERRPETGHRPRPSLPRRSRASARGISSGATPGTGVCTRCIKTSRTARSPWRHGDCRRSAWWKSGRSTAWSTPFLR